MHVCTVPQYPGLEVRDIREGRLLSFHRPESPLRAPSLAKIAGPGLKHLCLLHSTRRSPCHYAITRAKSQVPNGRGALGTGNEIESSMPGLPRFNAKIVNPKISRAQPQFRAKSISVCQDFAHSECFASFNVTSLTIIIQYMHPLDHVSADMATAFARNTRRVLAR